MPPTGARTAPPRSRRAARKILELSGIEHARGFALDSTHYTGPVENIDRGAEILALLAADGYGEKHFIVDTAKSGRPTMWPDIVPATTRT